MSHAEDLSLGEPFGVEIAARGDTVVASVSGELDLSTAGELEAALPPIPEGGRCILDLRRLSFMDSSGVRVVLQLDVRARAEGWTPAIVCAQGPVSRLLDVCRVAERVELLDELPPLP